jgi:hypothetical protein
MSFLNISTSVPYYTTNNVNSTLAMISGKLEGIAKDMNEQNTSFYTTTAISIVAIIAPVITAMYLFWRQQNNIRKDRIRRSCDTILKELDGTTDALIGDIRYFLGKKSESPIQTQHEIYYTNKILNTDAYDSILYSGLFSNISSDTQHSLSNLYRSAKQHNEIINYLNQFEDLFLLSGISESKERIYSDKISNYKLQLTVLEREILRYMELTKMSINTEMEKIL